MVRLLRLVHELVKVLLGKLSFAKKERYITKSVHCFYCLSLTMDLITVFYLLFMQYFVIHLY